MLLAFNSKPQTDKIRSYIAMYFNMESKECLRKNYGTFCHYLVYNGENGLEMGPDILYKLLRH